MARNALLQAQAQAQHTFVAINGKDTVRSLAEATVTLWKSGQSKVQYWPFHRSQQASYIRLTLPSYQFEKSRHWLEYTNHSGDRGKKAVEEPPAYSGQCLHCKKNMNDFSYIALQGQVVGKTIFKVDTRSKRYQDLVKGHVVVGCPICPAAMYLELASHAVTMLHDVQMMSVTPEIMVEAIEIKAPLGLDAQRSVNLTLEKKSGDSWGFELSSTKNSDKLTSHATGIISLRNSSIKNEQNEEDKWARSSYLLEKDNDTEALRGTMVYKVFSKMAKYSPAYRGLRHLVGKGSEAAGDISMPTGNLDVVARTPNYNIADPVVMDTFLQVPGAFVHSLRALNEEHDDDFSYICTGMGSVGPLNRLQGTEKYRAYAKIVREDNKMAVLDVFAFEQQSKKIIWSAKGLKFTRIPRNSLAKALAGATQGTEPKEQAASPLPAAIQSQTPKNETVPTTTPNKSSSDRSSGDVLIGLQEILSNSLEISVEEVTKQASLEELGMDSLVSSEVLANISHKFKIDILNADFAAATDVASLRDLISSRVGGDAADTSGDKNEDQGLDSGLKTAGDTTSEWKTTVFEILSQSLDLPAVEIEMDSKLEDLGADSLVAWEIISNLNEAFGSDISSDDFASIVDVASLCNLISGGLGVGLVQTPMASSSGASHADSASRASIPATPRSGATTPAESEKSTLTKDKTTSMHAAFQQARSGFDAHAKDTKLTGYWDHVYPQQLSTVAAFIIEAFEKLGCLIREFRQGERLPALQETLIKYHREVPRLWEILEEAGVVEKRGEDFLRGPVPLDSDISKKAAKELSKDLISDFPQFASTHGLPDLLGPHLAECLTGKADPVSLLFGSERGRSLLEDFYANGPDLRAATQVLCDFFSAAIRSPASDGEPFHVLEVGAGTGGTTKHLVPLLQATGLPFKYTFTELSVSLLSRAKKTFKGIKEMEFLKLNIEADPPEELLGRYHIVVSSNCVHATRDLRRCLGNIRKLVRPDDGCVALVELTQKLAWYDLVWGLLDGWWLFDDGREYALQSPWAWEQAMQDAGFAHVDWSEGMSRESRSVRLICGMVTKVEKPCLAKATSMLLHRGTSDSGGRNLFLIPDGFGSGAVFGGLQPLLGCVKDTSIYALNSPFIKNKPDPDLPPSIEELAATYVAEIKRRQPDGPYLIGGYSVGGVVAFEVVRQLFEDGNEVEKLFLIDTACPTLASSMPGALVDFLDSIDYVGIVNEGEIREKNRGRVITNDHFTLARQQLLKYRVSKLPGRKIPQVVLFSAREGVDKQDKQARPNVLPEEQRVVDWFLDDRTDDGSFGWDDILGNVRVVRADGNHFSMMKPPAVSQPFTNLDKLS